MLASCSLLIFRVCVCARVWVTRGRNVRELGELEAMEAGAVDGGLLYLLKWRFLGIPAG